jgi:tetratricopeptide (TPR) repeat protein
VSSLDLHPEDLMERARRGTLDRAAAKRLEAHLKACRICRVESAAMADFEREAAPQPGDDALLDRLVGAALDSEGACEPTRAPAPRARRRAMALHAAAAVALMTLAAAAAVSVDRLARAPALRLEASLGWIAGWWQAPARAVPEPSAASPSSSSPEAAPPASSGSARPLETAAELFRRANQERRSGSAQRAARLYRLLQQRHPDSREASASRLALARLLLDRLGDAEGALRLFDAYLAGGGVLSQEALLGRALALGQLGRTADERAAWESFLARYPDSVHAERARQRLEQLR